MEMHQIRYFLALAEELNFTKAAERCKVAQPSLTRGIKALEDELGGTLVHRGHGKTRLSELGRMVEPHLSEVYQRAEATKRQAAAFNKAQRTGLRLGVMCTIAPTRFLDLINGLNLRHPDVDLEIIDSNARALEERLDQGVLEAAIYCRPDHEDARLHYLKLFSEQMMIVVAPTHELAKHSAIRFKDLQEERYLNRINCEFNDSLAWDKYGVDWQTVYRSERDDWILAMCAAGMGFGFLPQSCVNHPGVVMVPVVDPEFWREVSVVTVRGRPHSPAVGALVREARRTDWTGQMSIRSQPLQP